MLGRDEEKESRESVHSAWFDYIYIYIYIIRSCWLQGIPCRCNSAYIDRTCQRLDVGIRQHVPRSILNKSRLTSGPSQATDSAIGERLLAINSCRMNEREKWREKVREFRACGTTWWCRDGDKVQLNILEAIYIAIDHPSLGNPRSSHILNILGDALDTGVTYFFTPSPFSD